MTVSATMTEIIDKQDQVTKNLVLEHIEDGVLIPLKTTLELRDDHQCGQALITRSPVKSASAVISMLRDLLPEDIVKGMPHLRRCAKPCDLPAHLKSQFMNATAQSKQIHTGKSNWVYIMLGLEATLSRKELIDALSKVEGMEDGVFIVAVPVPLLPPTSQVQAALWSNQFWPSVYRKSNPLGPHPSMVSRATEDIAEDAPIWMALARQVASKAHTAGYGEAMGACIVQREGEKTRLVALAADARWHKQSKTGGTGNPMAHAVLRAISMVAQKLVRAEKEKIKGEVQDPPSLEFEEFQGTPPAEQEPILEFEAFQDKPLVEEEERVFAEDHPCPDGYLCHGLELYLTHEPCVMCSMAILHSRMGKVVFSHRMPLTGGLGAEDRLSGHPNLANLEGGRGLGLFWRRELNWSLLAWEWEPTNLCKPLKIEPTVHA